MLVVNVSTHLSTRGWIPSLAADDYFVNGAKRSAADEREITFVCASCDSQFDCRTLRTPRTYLTLP